MSNLLAGYGIASYISQDILIVPFQADFYKEVLEALRQDILQKLHHNPDIKGLIIDLSRTNLIDLKDMKALESIQQMAHVLGVTTYLTGIQPSVTLTLVELGYDPKQINAALNISRATELIHLQLNRGEENTSDNEEDQTEALQDNLESEAEHDE